MLNSVDVMLVSVSSRMVAAIGRAADVIGCSRITFSVMSTQVLKSVVIQIVYQTKYCIADEIVVI